MHIGSIIGNFGRMRDKITALANDCGCSAMDIGLVDREDAALHDNAEQPTAEGRRALDLDEVAKRAPNPEIICWDCQEKMTSSSPLLEKRASTQSKCKRSSISG